MESDCEGRNRDVRIAGILQEKSGLERITNYLLVRFVNTSFLPGIVAEDLLPVQC